MGGVTAAHIETGATPSEDGSLDHPVQASRNRGDRVEPSAALEGNDRRSVVADNHPLRSRAACLYNGLLHGRNLRGDSQSKCGWVNSVARARGRFGHSGWRHPRHLSRTPHRGPASSYPNAPQSMATQGGCESAKKSASLGLASMSLGHAAGLGLFRAQASRRREILRYWGHLRAQVPRCHAS
jgi:hypothetical protein